MKLSQWAKKHDFCYRTAYNWFKAGKIPGARQLDSGTIIVPEKEEWLVAYGKKAEEYCESVGWKPDVTVKKKVTLVSIVRDGKVSKLVVSGEWPEFEIAFLQLACNGIHCEMLLVEG